jgi:hypothetical protein
MGFKAVDWDMTELPRVALPALYVLPPADASNSPLGEVAEDPSGPCRLGA